MVYLAEPLLFVLLFRRRFAFLISASAFSFSEESVIRASILLLVLRRIEQTVIGVQPPYFLPELYPEKTVGIPLVRGGGFLNILLGLLESLYILKLRYAASFGEQSRIFVIFPPLARKASTSFFKVSESMPESITKKLAI